jgi:hypothetical protein
MERKLVRQGRNALTVTLPSGWLKSKGLEAGNSIFIEEANNNLEIKASPSAIKKETTVNLTDSDRSMAYHVLYAKFIEGNDIINIIHNNPTVIQQVSQVFIGFILEEHTPTFTKMKNIIVVPEENFEAIIRRATHILLQLAKTLELVSKEEAKMEDINATEALLDANIIYCLRYITKYEKTESAYRYFFLCSTLEEAGDRLKRMAPHIVGKKELAKSIVEVTEDYVSLIFKKDLKKLYLKIKNFRNNVAQKTYIDGLAFCFGETLYNYIGYQVGEK